MEEKMTTRRTTRYHTNAHLQSFCPYRHHEKNELMRDISVEGLSFKSDTRYQPGTILTLNIPLVVPSFRVIAEVSWCQACNDNFEVGVRFLQVKEGFRIKTVEQLNYIEEYRKRVYFQEGRMLSPEEANAELVKQYRQSTN